MLLLDKKPSHSLLYPMLLLLHRTYLKPFLLHLQSSLLPQHLSLPFLLHLSQLVPLLLTLLSRPRLLPQSEPTPESLPKLPTLSHKSMSRNTMLMFLLLSHVLFLVKSLSTSTSLSLMRFPFLVLSQSQLLTRFTLSKRLLRPLTSTTQHMRLTPPMLSPMSQLLLLPQLLPMLLHLLLLVPLLLLLLLLLLPQLLHMLLHLLLLVPLLLPLLLLPLLQLPLMPLLGNSTTKSR